MGENSGQPGYIRPVTAGKSVSFLLYVSITKPWPWTNELPQSKLNVVNCWLMATRRPDVLVTHQSERRTKGGGGDVKHTQLLTMPWFLL